MTVIRRTAATMLVAAGAAGLLMGCSGDDDGGGANGEDGGSAVSDELEWSTAVDEASGFSVDLPGEATEQTVEAPLPDGTAMPVASHVVEIGDSQAAAIFTVYDLPNGTATFDLQASAEGSASQAGGTLTSSTPTTYEALEALDSEMSVTSNGVEGIGLMRLVKVDERHVVLLQVVGPAEDLDNDLRPVFDQMVPTLQLPA